MKKWNLSTPGGTRDFLFEESEKRNCICDILADTYSARGYSRVMTPSIEYYDVFTAGSDPLQQEMMYKLTDSQGRLLVLRPDSTVPIARLAATRLRSHPLPLRLFYNQPVFRMSGENNGRSAEMLQSGVELLGADGKKADLESIVMGIEALKAVKIENFRVEIGHVGFFKELTAGLNLPEEVYDQALACIEQKNYASLIDILAPFGKTEKELRTLRKLPQLFGGAEILERAADLTSSSGAIKILDYLKSIYSDLCAMGYGEHILLDLGLVHRIEYYTGIVFCGYVEGYGETILSGGRYDLLSTAYGAKMPAIGFAVNVDSAASASGLLCEEKSVQCLIYCEDGDTAGALTEMERMTGRGIRCELSMSDTFKEAKEYAVLKKIPIAASYTEKCGLIFYEYREERWVRGCDLSPWH